MRTPQIINRTLFQRISSEAKAAPRRRKNFNFHTADSDASHRLLNAMVPIPIFRRIAIVMQVRTNPLLYSWVGSESFSLMV